MKLSAGQEAIDFKLKDINGNEHALENYRGKKLLISFFRYASCPFCNLRFHRLSEKQDQFAEMGLQQLAFFESPVESILKHAGKSNSPIAIIADPKRKTYRQYGVETSLSGFIGGIITRIPEVTMAMFKGYLPGKMEGDYTMMPADILIGPDLKIAKAHYGKDLGHHLPLEEIEAWLKEY